MMGIVENINWGIQRPWEIDGATLEVTTSMDIAMAPLGEDFTKSSLMKKANIAYMR